MCTAMSIHCHGALQPRRRPSCDRPPFAEHGHCSQQELEQVMGGMGMMGGSWGGMGMMGGSWGGMGIG